MNRLIAIAVTVVVAASSSAFAQVSSTVSLAEVARQEEARRKSTKKATKVFTNSTLVAADAPPPSSVSSAPAAGGTAKTEPTIPLGDDPAAAEPGSAKTQEYWQKRMAAAREALNRTETFADAMQTKINSLQIDIPNLDYPARGLAEKQLAAALAELERLKKETAAQTKAIAAIEEEARRANVPSGWLRPGA